MFSLKKKLGRDKKKSQIEDDEGSTKAPSPSPTPLPSIANSVTTTVSNVRRTSEPLTNSVPRPVHLERLTSEPAALGASSTFGLTERSRSRSIDRRNDPLGLTIIHEPTIPPLCDLIFVHGLGGTSRATWAKGRDLNYFWPQKWLPSEPGIGDARILSFGYNANFAAAGPAPITGIADFARDLLYSMKYAKSENLEELELGQRPIIFIVHSMDVDGISFEQAYVLGKDNPIYSGMVSSISAVVFLATPHRGSNLAEMLNRILAASIFNHSPKLYVSELKHGSQTIEALNDQFRHVAPRLKIMSFYETLPTSVGLKRMVVVEKDSATTGYPNEISKSMNADHHTVCKFDGTQNADYISVRNALKTLITEVCSMGYVKAGELEQGLSPAEHLESLLGICENHQDDLEFFTKRWTAGTCEWILSHPKFIEWVREEEESPTILWLHALPGSGKSILSSFIINHLLKESFCVYYFFRFGDQSRRSVSTCLRTMAYQIAEQLPQFRHVLIDIKSSSKTLEKADPKTIWDKLFVGILFKLKFPTTMHWVIDALDESDHPQLLVEMMQDIAKSSAPIKMILVSRQNDDLMATFDRLSVVVPSVYLPFEDTKRDIRTCVEKEVYYMRAPQDFKSLVTERLVSGANGNFLWASLALVEVMRCNTREDLDQTLETIPSGMEQLYKRIEGNIIEKSKDRPQDRKLGHMILTWVACSRRPLVLQELTQALQPEFSVILDLRYTISRVCGQFVIVDTSERLVMIHQTARDYIMTTDSILAVNAAEAHEKLFTKCLLVLEGKWHRRGFDRQSGDQDFVHYAVTSWAYHFNLTSIDSDEPMLQLASFLKGNSILAWIVWLAQQNQLKVLVYTSKIMTLYVRRKRGRYGSTNPLLHRLQELDLVESWATDLLKLVGKFGQNLTTSPLSIYQEIPPFCPKGSMIYQHFEQKAPSPPPLQVEGITQDVWDDSLAKISLGPKTQTVAVICSGPQFAVLTGAGAINLYDSTTFEFQRTLLHAERVCALCFSGCSNLLATYGFRTTKVWSVKTGNIMYQVRNPLGSRAFTITFAAENTELVIGSNDRLIRVAKLTVANPAWFALHPGLLKEDTSLDRPVHNVPWRIAFNSSVTCVAVAYRGSPLCVWSLDPPELIRRCMRSQEYAGNAWTVVDQMIWHPQSEEVIGLYMGGHVFRWNPWDDTRQELQAYGSILASSPEGKFFVIGDSNGTIKLYNFQHFALIYQLSCENLMNDICFSPDSKRLYDLRGQFCNVWGPNALLRADESVEHESDIASEIASIPTAAVSEAVAEVRDQITALGVQFSGRHQAIGNEVGIVSLIDSMKGDHSPFQLCGSEVPLSIAYLAWSDDEQYLASAELTGKVVVKEVHLDNRRGSTVTPKFDVKLQVSPEGIQQILLDKEGAKLLVKNGPVVTIWSSTEGSILESDGTSIMSPDTRWIKHPKDSSLLLTFSPTQVRLYRWKDLSEVAVFDMPKPLIRSNTQRSQMMDEVDDLDQDLKIGSIYTNASGSHLLFNTVKATNAGQEHFSSIIQTSTLKPSSGGSILSPTLIPSVIQRQIEIPLGLLPKQRIIFLDKDYWMCSWRVGASATTEKVQRYYCLPKDWLNVECLKLCALLADGRFLIPYNGELAVIKSAAMSHW
ncbi:MAG: hypothetical protein Q9170_004159 [Blastenia crenularia]